MQEIFLIKLIENVFVDESTELDLNFDEEIAEIDEMREEVDEARKLGMHYTWNSVFSGEDVLGYFQGVAVFLSTIRTF